MNCWFDFIYTWATSQAARWFSLCVAFLSPYWFNVSFMMFVVVSASALFLLCAPSFMSVASSNLVDQCLPLHSAYGVWSFPGRLP